MKKRVVIVGGGFAGVNAAKVLADHPDVEVTLLDQRNHHLFQPLLYQVAMAGLSPAEIAAPIRSLFSKNKNIEVLLGKVLDINAAEKRITADFGELTFDYLILACGAQHSYFGKNQWEEYAPGLKTLEQATEIRRRILTAFEVAERESVLENRKKHLTFVVVGGGPTGVELAGSLSEMSRFSLEGEFKNTDLNQTQIYLVEGSGRVLAAFSEKLSEKALSDLREMGVTVMLNTKVIDISADGVKIETKEGSQEIHASTVVWAAGVKPSVLNQKLGTPLDPQGRAIIGPELNVPGHVDIFVIGDQAHFDAPSGKPLPGVAQVAIQQGSHVAKNILLSIEGKPRVSFSYHDKGQMATVGRRKAVLQTKQIELTGFIAWLGWLVIHIYYLIGFKNRLFVLYQWVWSYFTYSRGARLIVDKQWKSQ